MSYMERIANGPDGIHAHRHGVLARELARTLDAVGVGSLAVRDGDGDLREDQQCSCYHAGLVTTAREWVCGGIGAGDPRSRVKKARKNPRPTRRGSART